PGSRCSRTPRWWPTPRATWMRPARACGTPSWGCRHAAEAAWAMQPGLSEHAARAAYGPIFLFSLPVLLEEGVPPVGLGMGEPWDLGGLSVGEAPEVVGERRVVLGCISRRQSGRFIPPVPMTLFDRACVLPGKALAVYLLLWRQAAVERSDVVTLTTAGLRQHGLTRSEKETALRHLEAAGLVRGDRRGKKNPPLPPLPPTQAPRRRAAHTPP